MKTADPASPESSIRERKSAPFQLDDPTKDLINMIANQFPDQDPAALNNFITSEIQKQVHDSVQNVRKLISPKQIMDPGNKE